jgi:hypothetical protein
MRISNINQVGNQVPLENQIEKTSPAADVDVVGVFPEPTHGQQVRHVSPGTWNKNTSNLADDLEHNLLLLLLTGFSLLMMMTVEKMR